MILDNIKEALSFDDVLLVPQYSEIESRSQVSLNVSLPKGFGFKIPIISANMKNVTEVAMANALGEMGGLALLHRFSSIEEQVSMFKSCSFKENVGCSVGIKEKDKEAAKALVNAGCKILCLDVAHAHSKYAGEMVNYLSKEYNDVLLIAGNVATGKACRYLSDNGADVVKVGIGSGCFAAGTRILLDNGYYKNIENISIGDKVINKDGKSVSVKNIICTGIKKVVKVRHNFSYLDTYVTPDHQYLVGDLNSTSKTVLRSNGYAKCLSKQAKTKPKTDKIKWKKIGVLEQDCLLMPRNINFNLPKSFELEMIKKTDGYFKDGAHFEFDQNLEPSYDLGYVFGTFLGDGCARKVDYSFVRNAKLTDKTDYVIKWYFGLDEKDVVDKLQKAIKTALGKDSSHLIPNGKNVIVVSLFYAAFVKLLLTFGKKIQKKLPEFLLIDNIDYLRGIYDGLIDSDGSGEEYGRERFRNTSPELIELFTILQYKLFGFMSACQEYAPSAGGLKNCNIENCRVNWCAEKQTTGSKRLTKTYQISKLLEISNVEVEMPVYDIEVDCDTHSFIANNAIVHNSICTTRLNAGAGVPQLSALDDCRNSPVTNHGPIISDGGTRRPSDLVKALCFADMVMLGNMLAGTTEAPGNTVMVNGVTYKEYAGSSTLKSNHIEGVVGLVPTKGSVQPIIEKILEGVRSGLSYQGVSNLKDLKINPQFVRITGAGLVESHAHDIKVI